MRARMKIVRRSTKLGMLALAVVGLGVAMGMVTWAQSGVSGGFSDTWGPQYRSQITAPATAIYPSVTAASAGGTLARVKIWNFIAGVANAIDHTPVQPGETRVFGEQFGPARSARALAIVHIALFEAVNAVAGGYRSYLGLAPGARRFDRCRDRASDARCAGRHVQVAGAAVCADPGGGSGPDPQWDGQDEGHCAWQAGSGRHSRASRRGWGPAHRAAPGHRILPARGRWLLGAGPRQPDSARARRVLGSACTAVRHPVGQSIPNPAAPSAEQPGVRGLFRRGQTPGWMRHRSRRMPRGFPTSTDRTSDQTVAGIYWGYDGTPGLGTPPRLYNQIARQDRLGARHQRGPARAPACVDQCGSGRCRAVVLGVEVPPRALASGHRHPPG